jgi:hypothetical protein
MLWTGLVWLRIGTVGELLWTRWWNCGFHRMLGITEWLHKLWPLERYSAAQNWLVSGGRSVGIVRLRTRGQEVCLFVKYIYVCRCLERMYCLRLHCKRWRIFLWNVINHNHVISQKIIFKYSSVPSFTATVVRATSRVFLLPLSGHPIIVLNGEIERPN